MSLFSEIYRLVAKIPSGKITTYGQIAHALGLADSRLVGWALHANRSSQVPCHRVVNRFGRLAPGYAFGGPHEQKNRLLSEKVPFLKEDQVDLSRCLFKFLPAPPPPKP